MKRYFIFLFILVVLISGLVFGGNAVFAALNRPLGGRVISVIPHPAAPGDPCSDFTPYGILLGPPSPPIGMCGMTSALIVTPPRIGSWFLGIGTVIPGHGVRIIRGAFSR